MNNGVRRLGLGQEVTSDIQCARRALVAMTINARLAGHRNVVEHDDQLTEPLSVVFPTSEAPVADVHGWVNRSVHERREEVRRRPQDKIPRPMNSFMLYRRAFTEPLQQSAGTRRSGRWIQTPLTWFDTGDVGYTEDTGDFVTTGDAGETAEATLGWRCARRRAATKRR